MTRRRVVRAAAVTALAVAASAIVGLAGPRVMWWYLDGARETAKRPTEPSNLHRIGLALHYYRRDHGQSSATLEQLYPTYLENAEDFLSPVDRSPHEGAGGLRLSFVYVGNLPKGIPDPVIICYTRRGVHDDGRHMLSADNMVWWMDEGPTVGPTQRPRITLRESYDAVVVAYGQALTPERDAELRKFYEIND